MTRTGKKEGRQEGGRERDDGEQEWGEMSK